MATTMKPYGLRPSHLLGAKPYNGAFTKYRIVSNATTPIFNGDLVKVLNTGTNRGYVERMNATVTATTVTSSGTFVGVFVGCEYTDPVTGQLLQRPYYPGAIVASDIWAFVVDDPDVIFRMQADEALAQSKFGCNYAVIQHQVGSTFTGNSGLALDGSSFEETSTLPLRLMGFVDDPDNPVGTTYPEVYVRINNHFHRTLTGTDNS